jgi:hypothetical protein
MTTLVGVFRKLWLWDWLRGRRGRGRQVAAVAIYGFVALVVIGAASPSTKKKASPVAQVRATGSQPNLQQQRPAPKRVDRQQARRVRSQPRARRARANTRAAAKQKAQPAPSTTTRPTSTRRTAPPPTVARPTTTTTTTSTTSSGANCTPGYSPCIPPGPDVDCAGGSGNGPRYVPGPVQVTGSDPYRLDADGDGVGCDS